MGMKDQPGDFTTHIQRPSMLRWMSISNGAKQVLGKLPDRRRGGLHFRLLQVSARSKFNAVVAAYISRRTSRQLPNAGPPGDSRRLPIRLGLEQTVALERLIHKETGI
jgi:hypothetical protein